MAAFISPNGEDNSSIGDYDGVSYDNNQAIQRYVADYDRQQRFLLGPGDPLDIHFEGHLDSDMGSSPNRGESSQKEKEDMHRSKEDAIDQVITSPKEIPNEKRAAVLILLRQYYESVYEDGTISTVSKTKSDRSAESTSTYLTKLSSIFSVMDGLDLNEGRNKTVNEVLWRREAVFNKMGICKNCRNSKAKCEFKHHKLGDLIYCGNYVYEDRQLIEWALWSDGVPETEIAEKVGPLGSSYDVEPWVPALPFTKRSYPRLCEEVIKVDKMFSLDRQPIDMSLNTDFPNPAPQHKLPIKSNRLTTHTAIVLGEISQQGARGPHQRHLMHSGEQAKSTSPTVTTSSSYSHIRDEGWTRLLIGHMSDKTLFQRAPNVSLTNKQDLSSPVRGMMRNHTGSSPEPSNGQTLPQANDKVMTEIMTDFWKIFNRLILQHMPSPAECQSTSRRSEDTPGTQRESRKRRAACRNEDETNDGKTNDRKRTKIDVKSHQEDETQPKFACPFRKHDPIKYCVGRWHPCAITPRDTIGRLKEHLTRAHRIWQCLRCYETFNSEKENMRHLRGESVCELVRIVPNDDQPPLDGITETMVKWFEQNRRLSYTREFGKSYLDQTEEERWASIYKKLFPNEPIPSPYFDAPRNEEIVSPNSNGIGAFRDYLRQTIPGIFRTFIGAELANNFQSDIPPSTQLSPEHLLTIFHNCLDEAYHRYPNWVSSSSDIGTIPSVHSLPGPSVPLSDQQTQIDTGHLESTNNPATNLYATDVQARPNLMGPTMMATIHSEIDTGSQTYGINGGPSIPALENGSTITPSLPSIQPQLVNDYGISEMYQPSRKYGIFDGEPTMDGMEETNEADFVNFWLLGMSE